MKLIFSLVAAAAMLLVVSYSTAGAFATIGDDTTVTLISLITALLKGLRGGIGGGSSEPTTANAPPPRPFSVPDFSTCQAGNFPGRIIPVNCCPPVNTTPAIDFTLLPKSKKLRVRRALHLLDDEYMAKFSRASQLMRALPDDDPRNFIQQANVHCAYCGGAHAHVGFPEKLLDVHFSWLFFPWHRMYTYFYERILGKLIDDPTFALPYWNWDSPESMRIPESFAHKNSTFYEEIRDEKHQPPATIDLNYEFGTDSDTSDEERKKTNLAILYRQVVSGSTTAELFHGKPYRPGDDTVIGRMGSLEAVHGVLHDWIGDRNQPDGETMGSAYLSARDPLFFVHHPNTDRMWTIWKTLNRTDLIDPDWLNSGFMFYDEEARLVKIKVKDCLDTAKMGYIYDDSGVAPPWLNARPTPRNNKKKKMKKKKISTMFPMELDEVVRVVVPRQLKKPEMSIRNNNVEVLVIEGIIVGGKNKTVVKFDVIINDGGNEDGIGPANTEFAGSYLRKPSSQIDKREKRVDSFRLGGISELLEDLGAQLDESVVVTLVPRYDPRAGTSVTIGGIKFEFA